jgi:hypothetical protein
VRFRSLLPFLLVGLLLVLSLGAAIIGFRSEPNATGDFFPNDPQAAAELGALAQRTSEASSFTETIRVAGPHTSNAGVETVVYNAPDRVELFSPVSHKPAMIEVGGTQYTNGAFGPGWAKLSVPARAAAQIISLGVLTELRHAAAVEGSGSTFVARSFGKTGGTRSVPVNITSIVETKDGWISSIHIGEATSDPTWNGHVVDVTFSFIDHAPTVSAPLESHAPTLPSFGPCTSSGSTSQCPIRGVRP